jgi:DNA-directed RNA polymerase subunit beta'
MKCLVEITESKIRNYRMGYIKLNSYITHPWYLKGNPNYISLLLNKSISETLKINSSKAYIFKKQGNQFAKTGTEAIYFLLKDTNLKRSLKKINEKIKIFQHKKIEKNKPNKNITKKIELYIRKLKITNCFLETKTLPQWMTFKFLPVLPPNVRPIIKLEDKKIITTDLNQLYCKIININNKITKLKKMLIQEKYLNNEKSILQESVNELIINNEKIKTKKKLKSITKRIEGKKGRFRENLLGKTVDYSGRSVITIEPKLKLKECTIPEEIALELFQPQIIKCLLNLKIVKTVREAKKKIKLKKIIVIQILKNILEKLRIKKV